MRPILAVTTAMLLLLGAGVAEAADSTRLAETGGFLLGNAHRCGIPTDQVERAGIQRLIVAASYDATEEAAVRSTQHAADHSAGETPTAQAYPITQESSR